VNKQQSKKNSHVRRDGLLGPEQPRDAAISGDGRADPQTPTQLKMKKSDFSIITQVVLNGRFDRHFMNVRKRKAAGKDNHVLAGSTNDNMFDIMPRELGMMLRQTHDADISRPINYEKDREIRIFTSANAVPGLGLSDQMKKMNMADISAQREFRAHLRDQFVFVGVPQTKVIAANTNQTDAVAVQVSGSVTIFNTGVYEINAFDLVCWDIPYAAAKESDGSSSSNPAGIPDGKQLFHTVPLRLGSREDASEVPGNRSLSRSAVDDIFDSLKNGGINSANGMYKKRKRGNEMSTWEALVKTMHAKPNDEQAMKNVLAYWTHAQHRFNSRVIGVALSKARPGEQFDILLQRCM